MPTWRVQFSSSSALAFLSSLLVWIILYIASSDLRVRAVRKVKFQLYIRRWSLWVGIALYSSQSHVRARYRCVPCRVSIRLLSAAYGWCRHSQCPSSTRVRTIHLSLISSCLFLQQRNIWILALHLIHTMVHILSFWDFRSSASYVGPAAAHCLSNRPVVWMFCSP